MGIKEKMLSRELIVKMKAEKGIDLSGRTYGEVFKALQKRGFEIIVESYAVRKWKVKATKGLDWIIIATDLQFCLDKTIEAMLRSYDGRI